MKVISDLSESTLMLVMWQKHTWSRLSVHVDYSSGKFVWKRRKMSNNWRGEELRGTLF